MSDTHLGLPLPSPGETVLANPASTPEQRRDALQDDVFAAYPHTGTSSGSNTSLPPAAEHPANFDTSAVFIARVLLPVGADDPPVRTDAAPLVDNYARRFVPSVALLARWTDALTP